MSARTLNNIWAFVLGVALAATACFAFADESVSMGTTWKHNNQVNYYATPQLACTALEATTVATATANPQFYNCMAGTYLYAVVAAYYQCPTNSTQGAGNTCSCNTGYQSTGSQCAVSCAPKAGQTFGQGYYNAGPVGGAVTMQNVACQGGCYAFYAGTTNTTTLVNGIAHFVSYGNYAYSGRACVSGNPAPASTAAVPAPTCGANQGTASMNGKTVCVDQNTGETVTPYAPPAPKTATTTKNVVDNGNGTTTETTTTTFPDGSTKTDVKTTTTATGQSTTTSTTSGGSGGAPRLADTNGQPTDKLTGICESNPTLPICQGDIATESTQKQIRDLLNPDLSATDTTFQSSKDAMAATLDGVKTSIEAVPSMDLGITWDWNPVIPSATCSPWNYGVLGHMYTWDVCPVVEKVRDILGYAVYVLTAFLLFNILAESNKGA